MSWVEPTICCQIYFLCMFVYTETLSTMQSNLSKNEFQPHAITSEIVQVSKMESARERIYVAVMTDILVSIIMTYCFPVFN
jgi:hypothetical protein